MAKVRGEAAAVWIDEDGKRTDARETRLTSKQGEMRRGMDHWAMRATNNPLGRICGFHIVF